MNSAGAIRSKKEEIHARQHMQHETNYHTVNLEQAPAMVEYGR